MYKIFPKIFAASSTDESHPEKSQDRAAAAPWSVAFAPILVPDFYVPYDSRLLGLDLSRETSAVQPARVTEPWPEDSVPQRGRSYLPEQGVIPFTKRRCGDAAGTDRGNALPSALPSEPHAGVKSVANADNRTPEATGDPADNCSGASGRVSPPRGWLASIAHGLLNLLERGQRWLRARRSAEALARLDDRTLRDIGIHHRVQIPDRVRFEP